MTLFFLLLVVHRTYIYIQMDRKLEYIFIFDIFYSYAAYFIHNLQFCNSAGPFYIG